MKYLLIISTILFITGIVILFSPISGKDFYSANGRLQLNDTQWEQFKIDIYNQKDVSFKQIHYIDNGTIKIVEFDDIRVSKDFQYGTITKDFKKGNTWIQIFEVEFIALGIVGILFAAFNIILGDN